MGNHRRVPTPFDRSNASRQPSLGRSGVHSGTEGIVSLQRLAGNRATTAAIRLTQASSPVVVQRHGESDEETPEQTDQQQHLRNVVAVAPGLVDQWAAAQQRQPNSRQVRRARVRAGLNPNEHEVSSGAQAASDVAGSPVVSHGLTVVNGALQFRQNLNSGQRADEAAVNAGVSTVAGNQIGAMEMGPRVPAPTPAPAGAAGTRAARRAAARAAARDVGADTARAVAGRAEGAAVRAGERRLGYAGVGGSPAVGWTDVAVNAVNDAAALAHAPRPVTDLTGVAASVTPSSFGTSVVSHAARGLYNTAEGAVSGDFGPLHRQGEEIMHGSGGAYPLQGYGLVGVGTAAAAGNHAANEQLNSMSGAAGDAGDYGPLVRWGNELGDFLYDGIGRMGSSPPPSRRDAAY